MDKLILTPLKQIANPKGEILHALKKTDNGFIDFGEAYFSSIHFNEIKGWKKHTKMTLNLIVPIGEIMFVVYDDRDNINMSEKFSSTYLSKNNYQRLTVPPGYWVAFKGIGTNTNLLLNIASIEHDPVESENIPLDAIDYDWSKS